MNRHLLHTESTSHQLGFDDSRTIAPKAGEPDLCLPLPPDANGQRFPDTPLRATQESEFDTAAVLLQQSAPFQLLQQPDRSWYLLKLD